MTSVKSSRENRYTAPRSYFGFLFKQNWPILITNLIILILINIIPLYMFIDDELLTLSQEMLTANMIDIAQTLRAVNTIAAALLAVIWGSGFMSYLNSKSNVQFYHSIPMTRASLYVHESLVKVISYLLPMALTTLFSILIMGARLSWNCWVVGIQLSGFLYSAAYFLFYFCVVVFAASFTGTVFSRILSAGLVVFLPSAIIGCLTVIWSYNSVYSTHDWALEVAGEILMPVRTIMVSLGEDVNVLWELLVAVGIGLVLWAVGLLIYRVRKSELSGTPVISKVAAGVIKYSCMFCASVVGGIFFQSIAGGDSWFISGALIGALLSLMLINTILTKSAKQMFRGLPGFGIFCAAFLAVFILFGVDVIGMDRYVPSASVVKYISVSVDDVSLRVDDREDVERLTDAVQAYLQENPKAESAHDRGSAIEIIEKSGDYETTELTDPEIQVLQQVDYVTRRQHPVYVRFVTRLGFIYEKTIRIYPAFTEEEGVELLSAIADSKGFVDAYFGRTPSDVSVYVTMDNQVNNAQLRSWMAKGYPDRLANMREDFNGMDYFQRGTFVTMTCRGEHEDIWYPTITYPVFDPKEGDWLDFMKTIEYVYVLNNDTGEMTKFEDEASIRTICESTSFLRWNAGFTLLDPTYTVSLFYEDDVCAERSGAFVRGLVPEFIP